MATLDDLVARIDDLERRLARTLQVGVIDQADYDAARVRVRIGERLSPWLPWATRRAGGDVDWWAPEVGEQVEVHAPNGEMPAARVWPAWYSDQVPSPSNTPDIRLIRFGNGTEISHDRANNLLMLTTPDDIQVHAEGNADITIDGNVSTTVGGDMTANVTGALSATAATAEITSGGNTINGPLAINGQITASQGMTAVGDVIAGGKSLMTHTHPGDSGGMTGPPN